MKSEVLIAEKLLVVLEGIRCLQYDFASQAWFLVQCDFPI
jgi:hypothetical protein